MPSPRPATSGPSPSIATRSIDVAALRDGDIILRRGRDMTSRLVLSQGQSARYSHVGLIVRHDQQAFVIHAIPADDGAAGGVRRDSLEQFIADEAADQFAILRVQGMSAAQRRAIGLAARAQLGLPFDQRFELSNLAKAYCSALVLRAFASAGITLVDQRAAITVPLLSEPVIPPDHIRQFATLPLTSIFVSPQSRSIH